MSVGALGVNVLFSRGLLNDWGVVFPILFFGNLWRHDASAPELIFVMAMTVILSGRCAWQGPRK